MDDHPWESARIDFEMNVVPQLRAEGASIGDAARNGNQKAVRVIEVYTMLHRSFDPVTLLLLKEALVEYRASI